MSKRPSNRKPRRKRPRRLFAEALESRQLLAADVFAVVDGNQVIVGDHNHDNVVNSHDLGILLNNYHVTEGVRWEHGDANADSTVNSKDLGLLLNNFNIDRDAASRKAIAAEVAPPTPLIDDHANEIGSDATLIDTAGDREFSFGDLYGELEVAGDVDVFQFTSDADQPFLASTLPVHFGGNTKVELLDVDGSVVAASHGEEAFLPVNLDANLEAGLYYLRVSSVDDAIGSYSTRVEMGTFVPPIADDHADEIGPDATEIELVDSGGAFFGSAFGTLEEPAEYDAFQFDLSEDLWFSGQARGTPFDTPGALILMSVLDSAGDVVETFAIDRPVEIGMQLAAGQYYLLFEAAPSETRGEYFAELTFDEFVPPPPPPIVDDHADEIGPDATTASFFEANGVQFAHTHGTLEEPADVDVFQFTISEATPLSGAVYTFSSTSIVADVLDVDGDVLATVTGDASAGYFDVTIKPGEYYLAVRGTSEDIEGYYSVDLQLGEYELPSPPTDDHADDIAKATVIERAEHEDTLSGYAEGLIGTPDDYDVFQFTADTDESLSVFVSPDWVGGGTIELLDAGGLVITSLSSQNRYEGLILDAEVTAGTYFLRVSGSGDPIPQDWGNNLLGPFSDPFASPFSTYYISIN